MLAAIEFGHVLAIFAIMTIPIMLGVILWTLRWYTKVDQGKALIINKLRGQVDVVLTGATVIPMIHRAEIMDVTLKRIQVDREGSEGVICRDNTRADLAMTFHVMVKHTQEDIIHVARKLGCDRAGDPALLGEMFHTRFADAVKDVAKTYDYDDLKDNQYSFAEKVKEEVGPDLDGFVLEHVNITSLQRTPLEQLDPHNILDAEAIKKLTGMTIEEYIACKEHQQSAKN